MGTELTQDYYNAMWELAKEQFILDEYSIHGVVHWESVYENGIAIGKSVGADLDVIKHFAIFHDCKREDDDQDPFHGDRACEFISTIRNQIKLSDRQFNNLLFAIKYHSFGDVFDINDDSGLSEKTYASCWDADRLELIRCGTIPKLRLMSTSIGKLIASKIGFVYQNSDLFPNHF